MLLFWKSKTKWMQLSMCSPCSILLRSDTWSSDPLQQGWMLILLLMLCCKVSWAFVAKTEPTRSGCCRCHRSQSRKPASLTNFSPSSPMDDEWIILLVCLDLFWISTDRWIFVDLAHPKHLDLFPASNRAFHSPHYFCARLKCNEVCFCVWFACCIILSYLLSCFIFCCDSEAMPDQGKRTFR